MKRPQIIITDSTNSNHLAWFILKHYLRFKGYNPVYVTEKSGSFPQDPAGIILLGGSDINPDLYGGETFEGVDYDDKRDAMERDYIRLSMEKKIPILGICRGMQMINVILGGSLYQNISDIFDDFLPTRSTLGKIFARRQVTITQGTKLHAIMKHRNLYKVNSLHHQGINELGKGLRSSAVEKNGLIQAIEIEDGKSHPFLIGVQWHPEYILHHRSSRRLFGAFLQAVSENQ